MRLILEAWRYSPLRVHRWLAVANNDNNNNNNNYNSNDNDNDDDDYIMMIMMMIIIIMIGFMYSLCSAMLSWGSPGIILCMRPANERRRYMVTLSLIGRAHTQNDPWIFRPSHDASIGLIVVELFHKLSEYWKRCGASNSTFIFQFMELIAAH